MILFFQKKKVKQAPYFLKCISKIFYNNKLLRNYPSQIITNKYIQSQGISAHRDHYPIFDNDIATLSLGSPIVMEFKPHRTNKNIKHQDKKIELLLKPFNRNIFHVLFQVIHLLIKQSRVYRSLTSF